MSIKLKLAIMFLAIATIPLVLVGALTFHNYKEVITANHIAHLQNIATYKADKVETYFTGVTSDIKITQGFYNIKKNLPILTRLADDPNNAEFVAAQKMLDNQLRQMQSVLTDVSDIMLAGLDGKVVYANKPGHYSKDLSNSPSEAERNAFSEGKDKICLSDIYFDKAEDNRFEMLVTAPAFDFNNVPIGVIAFEVDMTTIYKLIAETAGLGKTGEVIIGKKTGGQVIYLNPLRGDPNAVLTRRINIGGEIAWPMQQAVQQKTASGQYLDYRGKNVIAAWRYIPSLDWGLVAKIDTDEVFADVTNLRNLVAIILAIVVVLSSVTAFSIAQSISEPIKRLSEGAEIIGSGNLDYKIGTNLKDEIGQLSRSFDKMTGDLKQTTASRDELNREIIERKQVEQALLESKRDLDRAQAVASTGSWRLDIKRDILTWSDEAYRIFGVPVGTPLTYETFLTYIHPDDCEYVDAKWKAALAGEKYDIEHRIFVDSQIKWVRERAELEIDKDGTLLGGFGTVTDITERKKKEEELRKLNRTLRALSNSNQALMKAKSESEFLEEVCDIVVRDCGHVMSWVGFAGDDENKTVRPVASAGFEQGYLETLTITWSDTERGRGPTGTAIRTGRLSMCRNMLTDPAFEPWRQEAIKRGYASSIVLPIISDGKTFGALTIYSREPDPFSDDEVKLLTELADDLAYGIAAIRLRIAHTQAEELLRKSHDELEIRVKERTADLDEAVSDLQKQVKYRIKAEEALRSSALYMRGLLEASLDPLVTISQDGKITDVNTATELVTGAARDQLIGTDFSNYFTEPEKARKGYQQVFANGFVTDYALTIRHRNGQLIDVLYNAAIYKNEAGEVQGVFAAARDITERKAAEDKQLVTNSLLALFAQKTSRKSYLDSTVGVIRDWSDCEFVGIRIKDNEGNIPYAAHVGFDKDFLAKENMLHLVSDKCLCIRAITQKPQGKDQILLTAGGSFYSNDSMTFLKGLSEQEAKEYRGHCIIKGFQSIAIVPIRYRDEVMGAIHITDYKKDMVPLSKIQFMETTIAPLIGEAINRFNAEFQLEQYRLHLEDLVKHRTEELARSNKDLEQFAYVASHDLQEPLRAVSGFVSLLRLQLQNDLDAKKTEYMNFVVDGVSRMQTLINGLLEYSRIDTRGKPPQPSDSKVALEHALLALQAGIKDSGAKITSDGLPTVSVDPVQLSQVFQNLIGNAIKFRSDLAPEIHVSAVHQDGAWRFAVSDNGIGIDPQYANRIFLIFQRLHTRKKYPGTGIGLALCKKIVERHGGKIWVESGQGRGSTFYFTLP